MQNTIINPEIYKYRNFDRALTILRECSVGVACPAAFNDPFDMKLETPFPTDAKTFSKLVEEEQFKFLCEEIDFSRFKNEKNKPAIKLLNTALRNASPEIRAEIFEELLQDEPHEIPIRLEDNSRELINTLNGFFETWGIFCASKSADNLVMWSHYAEEHAGAVLGFTPRVEIDSVFIITRPVVYAKERPLVHRTAREFIDHAYFKTPYESAMEIMERIIYTKSSDWSYEQEYRVSFPDFIQVGNKFNKHRFHPQELTSIYLGCRIDKNNKELLIQTAKSLNPSARIFQMEMNKAEYELKSVLLT